MTLEQLIRWRAEKLVEPTVKHVLAALSVEGLRYNEVPPGAYEAIKQFRHLNTADRLRYIKRALRDS